MKKKINIMIHSFVLSYFNSFKFVFFFFIPCFSFFDSIFSQPFELEGEYADGAVDEKGPFRNFLTDLTS